MAPYLEGGTPLSVARATGRQVIVNQLDEDVIWDRGRHTWRGGTSVRLVRNDRFSEATAYPTFEVGTFIARVTTVSRSMR